MTSKAQGDVCGGPDVKDKINSLSMELLLMASLWYTVDTSLLASSIFKKKNKKPWFSKNY